MQNFLFTKNSRNRVALLIICLLSFFIRRNFWISSGGLYRRLGDANMDGYLGAAKQLAGGEFSAFLQHRPTQILYPFLLTPISYFSFSEDLYVYWLHQIISLATLVLIYRLGKRLGGDLYGLIASFIFAIYQGAYHWLNWAFTEILYYFIFILFITHYLKCCRQPILTQIIKLCIVGVLLVSVKLDGIPVLVLSLLASLYFLWRKYDKTVRSYIGGLLVGTLVFFLSGLYFLQNPTVQDRVLTHIHVAHTFWLSTHTGDNGNAKEQEVAYGPEWIQLSSLPECSTSRAAQHRCMSLYGIQFIKEHPIRYLTLLVRRVVGLLVPSVYWTEWKTAERLKSFALSLFILIGILGILFYEANASLRSDYLLLIVPMFSSIIASSLYLADGDLRFRIPFQIIGLILAPHGWQLLLNARRTKPACAA